VDYFQGQAVHTLNHESVLSTQIQSCKPRVVAGPSENPKWGLQVSWRADVRTAPYRIQGEFFLFAAIVSSHPEGRPPRSSPTVVRQLKVVITRPRGDKSEFMDAIISHKSVLRPCVDVVGRFVRKFPRILECS